MYRFGFLVLLFAITANAMTGGSNTAVGAWPSFVSVVLPSNVICGGILIEPSAVLTTAACLLNTNFQLLNPSQVSVLTGVTVINFALPRTVARALYVHPQFNPFTGENDIGLIRLAANIALPGIETQNPVVGLAQLNAGIIADNVVCNAVAWNNLNNIQQQINAAMINRDVCNALPLNFGRIAESQMCAGQLGAGAGVCVGNRGGALYCNGRATGILIGGFGCGAANNPGIYTQIRFYRQWINEQLLRQDIPAANTSPIQRLP
jgi:secreted trypsin-like serine protease